MDNLNQLSKAPIASEAGPPGSKFRSLRRLRAMPRKRERDPRRLIEAPQALKTFVDTVVSGDIGTLPTQSQRALASAIRAYLDVRATRNSVMNAIPKLTKCDWKGVKASTLKDNYYRPPGALRNHAPRTKRYKAALSRAGGTS